MVTLDLSSWFSDWHSHFVFSGTAGLLAFWATLTTLLVLFKSVGFRHRSCALYQLLWVGLSIFTTSSLAALFSSFLAHFLQDYWLGPMWHIEMIIKFPLI